MHWDTLAVDDIAHLYDEGFTKVFFAPLIAALRAVCVDDMGREALRDGLKKVVIRYSEGDGISFQEGVLTFDLHPVSNLDDVDKRERAVAAWLCRRGRRQNTHAGTDPCLSV